MRSGRQLLTKIWFLIVAVILHSSSARAQSAIDDVHVEPRFQRTPADSLSAMEKSTGGLIRKAVELVLVPVTVMDGSNRIITGLHQDNFQLFEDKHAQPIKHFWREDTPVSVGIVLDVSGSMNTKIERARDAVATLLKASNPQDEFFLITFADQPTLIQDFTTNVDDMQGSLVFATPKGRTSLIDAIVLAIHNMKNAHYQRKALVIVSDGGDNRSLYTEKDLKSLIKEQDVLVYSIGVFDTEFRSTEEQLGPELLAGISNMTGASAYALENPNYLPAIAGHIAAELRNQYILGYSPCDSKRDGRWRKIKVSLAVPHGLPRLYVQARKGYYGPEP